jgi:hypothetical protein
MRSDAFHSQDPEATSTPPGGGCFFALFTPLTIILLAILITRMLTGETTRPWDLTKADIVHDVSAAAVESTPAAISTPNKNRIAPFFSPSVLYWETQILMWANDYDLDPNLVATVMQIESCGDPRALSPAGAMGLFQVMPYHFDSGEDPYKPNINAKRGLGYLRQSLDTHNSFRLAMAGYNGGIKTAAKPENQWPNETIRYAYWGSGIYQDALSGNLTSERLEEWFAAGGTSLCRQAEQRLGISP